jgi:hypothetical protein
MTVKSENDAFFNNYSGSTATTGGYANKVYFGQSAAKQTRMKRSGEVINIPAGDKTISITEAKRLYLTDEALRNKWNTTLRKNGITADPIQARAIWDLSVDGASDWYATSNGQQKITPEQYLGWYSSGKKKKGPALPTRQVYQVTEDEIAADIDEIMLKKAGRTVQDSDKDMGWYQDLVKGISKLYSEGVVTTVKEVKNPKTGKMEKVVTQAPGFSKEQIAEEITSTIEAEDPASVQRKQRIDNTKWLLSRGGKG